LALALPPLGILPALLAPAVLFLALLRVSGYWRGFGVAWLFAMGFHLAGLYWVGIAFFADAERFGALAVPGVIALAAILAVLTAAPLALVATVRWQRPLAAALVFAALWCVGELTRGRLGVQFPWNPLSLGLAAHDLSLQLVALIGTMGASFVIAWLAAVAGVIWQETGRTRHLALGLAGLIILGGAAFGGWRLTADLPLADAERQPVVRIVQGNIAQHHKWDPELRQRWFERHLRLSQAPDPTAPAGLVPDVIVWPESSVPYSLTDQAQVRELVGSVVRPGGHVLLGSDFFDSAFEPPVLHNSVYTVAANGEILARYDKVDLVPFGEFLPFRDVFGRLGLEALAVGSIDFSPGPGRATIAVDGLLPFSPLVCYEAAFAGSATDGSGRARWLVNLTNDAWFGISSGPHQHAGMARMRSVETGLPLVRAANTGISLVTDAKGRIIASLPLGAMGTIDITLPPALATPPLASRVPWSASVLMALGLLVALASEAAARRRSSASS
jgi:apolipoprotein N-acyltransferase